MDDNPAMRSKNEAPVREAPSFIEVARRSQIVSCAIDTLAEAGYQRTSLAEIAKRAGISKSVISYHFAGKEALLAQVVDEVYATARAVMIPRLEVCKTAGDMLREYLVGNGEFMRRYPNYVRAIVEIAFNTHLEDHDSSISASGQASIISEVESILRWGQESGEFRAFDVPTMAVAIRASIDSVPPRLAACPDLDVSHCFQELATLFDLATKKDRKQPKGTRT